MKNSQYFTHDFNARNDEKIAQLRVEHGWEGYGMYWALVEMMAESTEYKLCYSRANGVAIALNIAPDKLKDFVDYCCNDPCNLFESDDEYFYSKSLLKRMKIRDNKIEKLKKAGKLGAQKRYGDSKSDSDVVTTLKPSDSDVITKSKPTYSNKTKLNKIKLNKRKDIIENLSETDKLKFTSIKTVLEKSEYFNHIAEDSDWIIKRIEIFKNVDIKDQIEKADLWCEDKPDKRPKSNFKAFLTSWFGNAGKYEQSEFDERPDF